MHYSSTRNSRFIYGDGRIFGKYVSVKPIQGEARPLRWFEAALSRGYEEGSFSVNDYGNSRECFAFPARRSLGTVADSTPFCAPWMVWN